MVAKTSLTRLIMLWMSLLSVLGTSSQVLAAKPELNLKEVKCQGELFRHLCVPVRLY